VDKANQIKEHMPVVCSNGGQFATVDHIDGNAIKLTKDDQGQHHWIPLDWVVRVDQHVHIDRPGDQAMREWSNQPLGGGQQQPMDSMTQDLSSPI
jgi:hypothetical protein